MTDILSGSSNSGPNPLWHHYESGIEKRHALEAGLPTILLNANDIQISGVVLEVDDLEALQQATIDAINSMNITVSGVEINTEELEVLQLATIAAVSGVGLSLDQLEILQQNTINMTSGVGDGIDVLRVLQQATTDAVSGVGLSVDNLEVLQQDTINMSSGVGDSVDVLRTLQQDNTTMTSGVGDNIDVLRTLQQATTDAVSGVGLSVDVLEVSNQEIADNTDNIETLQQLLIDSVGSGIIIRDPDGRQADVVEVSGSLNAVMVQADSVLSVNEVFASGSVSVDAFSSSIDVSTQEGFYNNAVMVGSDTVAEVGVYASSDGVKFALVTTLSFTVVDTYLYYDLKGYETNIKLMPDDNADLSMDLIRTR